MFEQTENGSLMFLESLYLNPDLSQPPFEDRSRFGPPWLSEKSSNVGQLQAGAPVAADLP
jgi:hypothetical protein